MDWGGITVRAVPCGIAGCWCAESGEHDMKEEPAVKPPPTFEERVVALAKVLLENAPQAERWDGSPAYYTFSKALSDATDIILVSDHIIEENCTCD